MPLYCKFEAQWFSSKNNWRWQYQVHGTWQGWCSDNIGCMQPDRADRVTIQVQCGTWQGWRALFRRCAERTVYVWATSYWALQMNTCQKRLYWLRRTASTSVPLTTAVTTLTARQPRVSPPQPRHSDTDRLQHTSTTTHSYMLQYLSHTHTYIRRHTCTTRFDCAMRYRQQQYTNLVTTWLQETGNQKLYCSCS